MGFFNFLLFIGLIVLFINLRNLKGKLTSRIEIIEKDIRNLTPCKPIDKEKEVVLEEEPPEFGPEGQESENETEPLTSPPPIPLKTELAYGETISQAPVEKPTPIKPIPKAEGVAKPEKQKSEWAARWKQFKRKVDWEQFTGKKLSAWLGGLSLFIAAGFFVKFSIERNWFPFELRLAIGALIGIILIVISNRFKKEQYTIMRHTLVSCGIGILYSVIYAAVYYEYLTRPIGFGLLALVSAAAFVLAVYHKGVAISVLGTLGAYATPILVSTGSGNIVTLFIYLAVVNIGLYQVVRYLKSQMLILVACAGTMFTLAIAIAADYFSIPGYTIAGVWIANLTLFTIFLWIPNINPKERQAVRWTGNILYASTAIVALLLLAKSDASSLFTVTASIFGAVALAHRNEGWYKKVIPYSAVTFIIAFIWSILRFNPDNFSVSFVLFLLYGVAGGLGPISLIRKFGIDRVTLQWFQTFPVAVVAVSLIGFFKYPVISFWFWPIILCLQLIGIGISFIIGALIQVGLLILLLITGGLFWIYSCPTDMIGFGFFGFLLFAGIILCIAIFLLIKKLPGLKKFIELDKDPDKPLPRFDRISNLDQWMTAAPAVGAFVMLGAAFSVEHPFSPHPGMVTLVCFLALSLFLSKRMMFQPPATVALIAAVMSQSIWVMNPSNSFHLLFSAVAWSSVLFIAALIIPFIVYRDLIKWKQVINAWALFEVFQGVFVIYASSLYWENQIVKWVPLFLAMLKLPVVAILLSRLSGKPERNSILAFHGGVLLFYLSSLPVLVLDHGWIGLTFIFEASVLMWLNHRIVHPGIRWVAAFMAPVGLIILLVSIPDLKGSESLPILNSAVFSVAAAIIALGFAVKLSSFPKRELGKIDLPNYFLWITVGTGFYFLNLIISDLFGGAGQGFKVIPDRDFLHSACYALTWTAFGVTLWRIRAFPCIMRMTGFVFVFIGAAWMVLLPIILPESVAQMKPLINFGLFSYLPLMLMLYFIFYKEPWEEYNGRTKNILLALFLVAVFMTIKVESSTIFQTGLNFDLLRAKTASKAIASAAGWLIYGLGLLLWPKRLDRPFRIAGIFLIFTGIIKTIIFPFRFKIEFGNMVPLLNIPSLLFLFLLTCLIFLTVRKWKQPWPIPQFTPKPFWGIILAVVTFIILNIEIAGSFGIRGRPFSMLSHGSLAMQLAYSIGWLFYSIGLIVIGIKWDTVKVRWAAIILLLATSVKIFILDLWKLGQLYRVGSFVGLAVVLIMISFLYQRFLSEGKKDEK
jgi:uncharacterized membrane protein